MTTTETKLPKSYTPAEHEPGILERWERSGAFHAEPGGDGEPYCILIPPPNVTAALHLGHAFNNTLQDILVRFHRMRGFNTLWMPGTDHAGIATQTVVDKRLQSAGEPALKDYKQMEARGENGREQFIAKVQQWKDEYEATITEQLKWMGCSCDWERQRFTMDDMCAKAVREAFFQLFKEGLIYRGKRLVNWDPVSQTALADDEVEMKEVAGKMYYLRYPLVHPSTNPDDSKDCQEVTWSELRARGYAVPDGDEYGDEDNAWLTVATTRPETYLGDTAVAVNPSDPRAKALKDLWVQLPIVGRVIPIVQDDYVVMPDSGGDAKAQFATGFLKVTPAHDPNDWDIGQRHHDAIARNSTGAVVVNVLAPDATVSDQHGWQRENWNEDGRIFVGLSREEAREKVLAEFKAHKLLEQVRAYTHSVGHSYRSHVPIEPYLSDQWYVKVTDDRLVGEAQRALADEQFEGVKPPREHSSGGPGVAVQDNSGTAVSDQMHSGTGVPPVMAGSPPTGEPAMEGARIITRRNLPHWRIDGSTYFVTFRLRQGKLTKAERRIVLDAAMHWHGVRAQINLVTVMHDHVHMLIAPTRKDDGTWWTLSELLHSIKSFTAHEIQKRRGASGPLWQDESFDRVVRDDEEFLEKWNYMVRNPVEAGLADAPEEYPYVARGTASSAVEASDAVTGGTPVPPADNASDAVTGETPVPPVDNSSDGAMRFYPSRYAKMYQSWHDNLRDWCISRQLWWGHRIPVWELVLHQSAHDFRYDIKTDPALRQVADDIRALLGVNGIECEIAVTRPREPGRYQFSVNSTEADVILAKVGSFIATSNDPRTSEWPEGAARPDVITKPKSLSNLERQDFDCAQRIELYQVLDQDPDVLDTWFSSGLWPLSTMGWPTPGDYDDTKGLLDTFNPTSVLCTAREIITLWVSRMTMFNRFFTDDHRVPFKDVYIHAMIQDGHGQKMSKSLGNGVDPRDIIHSHGADALRYTLTQMATPTQDVRLPVDTVCPHCSETFHPKEFATPGGYTVARATQQCPSCGRSMTTLYGSASGEKTPDDAAPLARNTSSKFDLGRNFCNKLWNATRFALNYLAGTSSSAVGASDAVTGETPVPRLSELSIADRWIINRLHRTLHVIEDALGEYQFNYYADAMYDFIWRDFCDWYLELIKPTVQDSPVQQQVLRTVLNAAVRLLHPIAPFVTEALWPHISAVGEAGIEGVELPSSELLATAAWPSIDCSVHDEKAQQTFERVQELTGAIRNLRSERQVPPKKQVTLHATANVRALLERAAGVVETLAGLKAIEDIPAERPQGAIPLAFEGEELLLSGLVEAVDVEAERNRLQKVIEEKRKAIDALNGRLSKEQYVSKAPAHLVEESRSKLAEAQADLDAAEQALKALGGG